MFKRRFNPYIVGICIVAILSVSYVCIRAYHRDVEVNKVISEVQAFNRSVDEHDVHSSKGHTRVGEDKDLSREVKMSKHEHNHSTGDIEYPYLYEINGIKHASSYPKSKEELELDEWIMTGKLTPYVEQELKRRAAIRQQIEMRVLQRVVTPDGKLGQVIVPEYDQYEEGDAILQSELVAPESHPNLFPAKPSRGVALILPKSIDPEGVKHFAPDEYYEIEDPYEREEYFNKFAHSTTLGIPMDEVEAKIAAGELDVSLSDTDKQHVDEMSAAHAARDERVRLLDAFGQKPRHSDKSPVKVSFLPDTSYPPIPGWLRKSDLSNLEAEAASIDEFEYSLEAAPEQSEATSRVDREADQSFARTRSSEETEAIPPMPDSLTSETIKAQLKEQLSPEQFSETQRLLDEYGPVEGLRRFKKMHPDARTQFDWEREPSRTTFMHRKGQTVPTDK